MGKNNGLAFFYVKVKEEESILLTTVYRKKTFTCYYLSFQPNCSLKRKVNLIRALFHRANKTCCLELY